SQLVGDVVSRAVCRLGRRRAGSAALRSTPVQRANKRHTPRRPCTALREARKRRNARGEITAPLGNYAASGRSRFGACAAVTIMGRWSELPRARVLTCDTLNPLEV